MGSVHPVIFRTPMIGDALSSPAAAELVEDFTGAFKPVELDTVVDEIIRGIERRAKRTVVPRQHGAAALVPAWLRRPSNGFCLAPAASPARSNWAPNQRTDHHSTDRKGPMNTFADTITTTLALPMTLPNGTSINRLVKAAMSEQLAGPANQPTAELARVYRRWAHGGAGLIITGNVMSTAARSASPSTSSSKTTATSSHSRTGRPPQGATAPPRWSRSTTPVARPSPASRNSPLPPAPSRST